MRTPVDSSFWKDRRVLVTGHTGFKGTWLTLWLQLMGARVVGVSADVPTTPALFTESGAARDLTDVRADVRDADAVAAAFAAHEPEIVLHLAAQPLVRRSFADPRGTYEVNVMGTVNVLEAVRTTASVRAVVNVTSDKCYDNRDLGRPFVEDDPKGGHDPYSNSKGCAELVADAYTRSYFGTADGARLGSARAGNVIGGGDWGEDRLIPDIMRGAIDGRPVPIRNPESTRPWQHVLNPLSGYLRLAEALHGDPALQGGWNFGPPAGDARPVRYIVERLTEHWHREIRWEIDPGPHPHEARFLSLDSAKAREQLGWAPVWDLDRTLEAIIDWYRVFADGGDVRQATLAQISAFAES